MRIPAEIHAESSRSAWKASLARHRGFLRDAFIIVWQFSPLKTGIQKESASNLILALPIINIYRRGVANCGPFDLEVEIFDVERVRLNKFASRLNHIAHELGE